MLPAPPRQAFNDEQAKEAAVRVFGLADRLIPQNQRENESYKQAAMQHLEQAKRAARNGDLRTAQAELKNIESLTGEIERRWRR